MQPKFYVYVITDPRDSQPFYVGKGCGNRYMNHEQAVRRDSFDSHLPHHDRIREILATGLLPKYSIPFAQLTEHDALLREQILIEYHGRVNNGTGILLNQSVGGKNSGVTTKAVSQYDLDGNFIAHFESAKEAGELTTANQSYITQCCKGRRKSSGGYLWTYKGDNPPKYTKQYFTPVLQFDLNQALVAEFPSLTHAQNATGVELHNISECCRGRSKTAGGFIWRYKEKAL